MQTACRTVEFFVYIINGDVFRCNLPYLAFWILCSRWPTALFPAWAVEIKHPLILIAHTVFICKYFESCSILFPPPSIKPTNEAVRRRRFTTYCWLNIIFISSSFVYFIDQLVNNHVIPSSIIMIYSNFHVDNLRCGLNILQFDQAKYYDQLKNGTILLGGWIL